jgi:hypothetical protein
MKKLILILMLAISTTIVAQPTFVRGYRIHIGYDNSYGETIWQEGQPCNSLIRLDESKVTIFGETTFEYHIIRLLYNRESQAKWAVLNKDGELMYIYLGYSQAAGSTYLILESGNTSVCIYTYTE